MSAELSGELIDAHLAARHDELMHAFVAGTAGMCIALYRIRDEQTYKAKGFSSYGDFLKRQGISAANGRLFANAGPVFIELQRTGDEMLIKHVDMLKPIYKMPNAEKQAKIIRLAKRRADHEMQPLTADLIADVAERNFGWKKPAEYAGTKKQRRNRSQEDYERELKDDLDRAFRVIALCPLSGYEIAQRIGRPAEFPGFAMALQIMEDMRDA
jgi:hypothetical protein